MLTETYYSFSSDFSRVRRGPVYSTLSVPGTARANSADAQAFSSCPALSEPCFRGIYKLRCIQEWREGVAYRRGAGSSFSTS